MSESIPHLHDADCTCADCFFPPPSHGEQPLAQREIDLLREDDRRAAEQGGDAA